MLWNLTLNVLVDNAPVVKVFYSLANLKPTKHGFCNWQPPFHRTLHVIVQGVIWRGKGHSFRKINLPSRIELIWISQNNTTGRVFFFLSSPTGCNLGVLCINRDSFPPWYSAKFLPEKTLDVTHKLTSTNYVMNSCMRAWLKTKVTETETDKTL